MKSQKENNFMKRQLQIIFFFSMISLGFVNAQTIEKDWKIESSPTTSLDFDELNLQSGVFEYSFRDSISAKGNYLLQNKLLLFFYDQPQDSIRKFKISTLTDSTLTLIENEKEIQLSQVNSVAKETLLHLSKFLARSLRDVLFISDRIFTKQQP